MNTHGRLAQQGKRDIALAPESLASTSGTGAYFTMKGYEKALFPFATGAVADGQTAVAQVMRAADANGTSAEALTGATATITGSARAKKALLTGNTIADGTTVVTVTATLPNGDATSFTFTCKDTDPDQSAGEFASGSSDTEACANLAEAINALMGTLIKATGSSGTCVLEPVEQADGGKAVITLSDAHSTIVPSTLEAEGYVEVDAADLGDGFTHLALRITTDDTILVTGWIERGGRVGGRSSPLNNVAASKVL